MTPDLETLASGLSEPTVPHCQSDSDGDCDWKDCPQLVDYKSYCPYAKAWEAFWEAEGWER